MTDRGEFPERLHRGNRLQHDRSLPRLKEILEYTAMGKLRKDIAAHFGISVTRLDQLIKKAKAAFRRGEI